VWTYVIAGFSGQPGTQRRARSHRTRTHCRRMVCAKRTSSSRHVSVSELPDATHPHIGRSGRMRRVRRGSVISLSYALWLRTVIMLCSGTQGHRGTGAQVRGLASTDWVAGQVPHDGDRLSALTERLLHGSRRWRPRPDPPRRADPRSRVARTTGRDGSAWRAVGRSWCGAPAFDAQAGREAARRHHVLLRQPWGDRARSNPNVVLGGEGEGRWGSIWGSPGLAGVHEGCTNGPTTAGTRRTPRHRTDGLTCAIGPGRYGATRAGTTGMGLLMRFGFTAHPGFESRSLRPLTSPFVLARAGCLLAHGSQFGSQLSSTVVRAHHGGSIPLGPVWMDCSNDGTTVGGTNKSRSASGRRRDASDPASRAASESGRRTGPASETPGPSTITEDDPRVRLWADTRAGPRAGRGFHYQDVVGAWLCGQLLQGDLMVEHIVPEGFEDLSCEGAAPWHVQAKSRQEQVGDFTNGEVAQHVLDLAAGNAKRDAAGERGRPVLVLERPVAGLSLGVWGLPLGDAVGRDHPLMDALTRRGEKRGMSVEEIQEASRLVSIVVLPWRTAAEQTRDAISARHRLLPAAAEPVVLALRDAVKHCADMNAGSAWSDRAGLNRTTIERIVTELVALLDQASLEEALTAGWCEPVNFDEPLPTAGFYEGVDVQPGHITAGLPSPRPDVTGAVMRALTDERPVLVTGPSGIGKSAVMWAAAYSSRHILWYRVRQLGDEQVPALVRLARAVRPSSRSPVGFVVDAVGTGAAQAWDLLLREVAPVPGVLLLGSARSEDLLPLRTLPSTTLVRVALDTSVAERIHAALSVTGATVAPHWREAFEAANGLTLEFTYMLTQGRRLGDVIDEQVARRVVEGRNDELRLLACAAVAHQWGATLAIRAVQSHLGIDDAPFRAALARLDAEHLIRLSDDRLSGLHQLRSRALARATHAMPPPMLAETVVAVLQIVDDGQLQPIVTGATYEQSALDDVVLDAACQELARRPSVSAWTGVLQALRLVDFARRAASWAEVLDAHGVIPANRSVTLQMAMLGHTELRDMFKPRLRPLSSR
jgi:hypothetical protein